MGDLATVQRLLSEGVEVNSRICSYGRYGGTPLHKSAADASSEKDFRILRLLVEAGADLNATIRGTFATPLNLAASDNDIEVVELLLELGANPDSRDWGQQTPLMLALRSGSVERCLPVVRAIVKAGASVNARSCVKGGGGQSPLSYLYWTIELSPERANGLLPVVTFLTKKGAVCLRGDTDRQCLPPEALWQLMK